MRLSNPVGAQHSDEVQLLSLLCVDTLATKAFL
jgi:hypothetical protein